MGNYRSTLRPSLLKLNRKTVIEWYPPLDVPRLVPLETDLQHPVQEGVFPHGVADTNTTNDL
jgi:hypothetical protein